MAQHGLLNKLKLIRIKEGHNGKKKSPFLLGLSRAGEGEEREARASL